MNLKRCLPLQKILEFHYHLYMIIKINHLITKIQPFNKNKENQKRKEVLNFKNLSLENHKLIKNHKLNSYNKNKSKNNKNKEILILILNIVVHSEKSMQFLENKLIILAKL